MAQRFQLLRMAGFVAFYQAVLHCNVFGNARLQHAVAQTDDRKYEQCNHQTQLGRSFFRAPQAVVNRVPFKAAFGKQLQNVERIAQTQIHQRTFQHEPQAAKRQPRERARPHDAKHEN